MVVARVSGVLALVARRAAAQVRAFWLKFLLLAGRWLKFGRSDSSSSW
ncbi:MULTISPECIES: hypothetical protein [Pontibacillus]|uniref:Uncharacterized protein n=1 Tax=Pontibacillus chungwhensis TaxID=265426 RepID=A0ABY8V0Y0_9BACI|nr:MULTISPECIES: hypothetical protein [Pontibacillus]MCD5322314.1 hypothetical protein [Pontibacillus sp. HN14]WIF99606.1 hypothetical protein QNI29_08095 [Pontibacillus chungwhensis]